MILLLLVITVLDLAVLLDRKDRDREEDGNAFPASAPERDDEDSTRALVHPHEVESLPRFLVDFQSLGRVPLLPKIASTMSVFTQT